MRALGLVLLLGVPGCLLVDPLSGDYAVAEDGVCAGQWSHAYGNEQGVSVGGLTRNLGGQLYAVGAFSGELTFTTALTAVDRDVFVAKLDGDGNLTSAAASGVIGQENVSAVADAETGIVLAGTFGNDYQGCGASLGQGIFVTAVSPALELTTSCIPASGEIEVSAVAVDAGTTMARVAGSVQGQISGVATTERDGFVVSIDVATGTVSPPILVSGADEQLVHAIEARAAGGFFVAGSFRQALELGSESKVPVGGSDLFLAMFDAQAQLAELAVWGGEGDEEAMSIDADGTQLFLAGEVDGGSLDFGTAQVPKPDGEAVAGFVAAFELESPLPAPTWVRHFIAEDLDVHGLGATHGPRAAVFVGGTVWGALALDGNTVRGRDADMFVLRFDRGSAAVATNSRCGDADEQLLANLVTDPDDDTVFFATSLQGSIDFGGLQQHTSHGNGDC